jgi:plasmid stability protein
MPKTNVGLSKFIKDAWDLAVERAKINKALRILNKQEWSVEFLTALLVRAAKHGGSQLEMSIISPNGTQLVVRTSDSPKTQYKDEDILEHLDDELKVQQFIAAMEHKRSNNNG